MLHLYRNSQDWQDFSNLLFPVLRGIVAREQEAYGPYSYYKPRRGHYTIL